MRASVAILLCASCAAPSPIAPTIAKHGQIQPPSRSPAEPSPFAIVLEAEDIGAAQVVFDGSLPLVIAGSLVLRVDGDHFVRDPALARGLPEIASWPGARVAAFGRTARGLEITYVATTDDVARASREPDDGSVEIGLISATSTKRARFDGARWSPLPAVKSPRFDAAVASETEADGTAVALTDDLHLWLREPGQDAFVDGAILPRDELRDEREHVLRALLFRRGNGPRAVATCVGAGNDEHGYFADETPTDKSGWRASRTLSDRCPTSLVTTKKNGTPWMVLGGSPNLVVRRVGDAWLDVAMPTTHEGPLQPETLAADDDLWLVGTIRGEGDHVTTIVATTRAMAPVPLVIRR